jgi:hypothetical protein
MLGRAISTLTNRRDASADDNGIKGEEAVMKDIPTEAKHEETDINSGRRDFLAGTATAAAASAAVSVLGTIGTMPAFAQPARQAQQGWRPNNDALPPDIKADIERRSKLTEELPKPAGLRPNAQLDARFPVYFQTPVAQAMKYLTDYFAAFCSRDLDGVASTLHFPYATYEGIEPIVYETAKEFLASPPPSLTVTDKEYDHFIPGVYDLVARPGTYDILDNLQLRTYNSVNVGLELCYTRYRADGEKVGINQGIYAVTNNDGKWGLQLSSVIFTPTQYIGFLHPGALETHLRQGETGMMAWSYHDPEMLRISGNGGITPTPRRTASITAPPGTDHWIRAARAGTPMEPYNTKGRTTRLSVSDPNRPRAAAAGGALPSESYNMKGPNGEDGYFYELASGGVGKYAYTLTLPDSSVIHVGPDKAHTIGGYIRYTGDSHPITETRSLGIMVYDGKQSRWETAGGFGQTMRRDCTNDPGRV